MWIAEIYIYFSIFFILGHFTGKGAAYFGEILFDAADARKPAAAETSWRSVPSGNKKEVFQSSKPDFGYLSITKSSDYWLIFIVASIR